MRIKESSFKEAYMKKRKPESDAKVLDDPANYSKMDRRENSSPPRSPEEVALDIQKMEKALGESKNSSSSIKEIYQVILKDLNDEYREVSGKPYESKEQFEMRGKNTKVEGKLGDIKKDDQFRTILEDESLKYLTTKNLDYFNREYTGELDAKGYLIGKDGKTNTTPWQNIGGGLPMQEVLENAKTEFVKKFPDQALRYPETSLLAQRQSHSTKKEQLGRILQKTEAGLDKAREKLGIPKPAEQPPSISITNEELKKTETHLDETDEKIRQEEKQKERMESFLEREYGIKKDDHIDKAKEEPSAKEVADYLADKPDNKDEEIKKDAAEKIEKAQSADRPREKEQEESTRREAVGGLEQEDKKQKEKEGNIVRDAENDSENNSAEADRSEDVERNVEKSTQFAKEKIKRYEFCDQIKNLARTLQMRESENFTPIIHPDAISYLSASVNNLEDVLRDRRSSLENINSETKKIWAAINAIGQELPKQSRAIEDTDSLSRIASNLQNIGESSKRIMIELGGSEDENLRETFKYFRALNNLTENKWSYVIRKRQMVEDR
jgi:hypothetical protein